MVVKATLPPGPACNNIKARDAASSSRNSVSRALWSMTVQAARCHPLAMPPHSRGRSASQSGTTGRREWPGGSMVAVDVTLVSPWYPPCSGTELAGPAMTSSLAKPSAKLRRGSGGQPTRSSPLLAGARAWPGGGGSQPARGCGRGVHTPLGPTAGDRRPRRIWREVELPPEKPGGDACHVLVPVTVPRSLGFRGWFVRFTLR